MLVLLHGFGGRPELWDPVVARLPPGAALLSLPLPGHDPSLPLEPGAAFEDAVELLYRRLPETCELLGYSLGARMALGLALRAPERVRRLSLVGVHPGLARPEARRERARADRGWAERLRARGLGEFFRAWDEAPLFAGRRHLPAAERSRLEAVRARHQPEQLARAMEAMSLARMPHEPGRLARLEVPVQLVVGERDAKFRAIAQGLLAQLPDARLEVVPGVGHDVPLEAPDALAALIRSFHGMG